MYVTSMFQVKVYLHKCIWPAHRTDPFSIIYLRQVHEDMVSSCVLFISSSDFYFHIDVSAFQQSLCLWLCIFAWVMTRNVDDDGTQQVGSGVLNNPFILQATSGICLGRNGRTGSHHHQLFVIYKCANFLVTRGILHTLQLLILLNCEWYFNSFK